MGSLRIPPSAAGRLSLSLVLLPLNSCLVLCIPQKFEELLVSLFPTSSRYVEEMLAVRPVELFLFLQGDPLEYGVEGIFLSHWITPTSSSPSSLRFPWRMSWMVIAVGVLGV